MRTFTVDIGKRSRGASSNRFDFGTMGQRKGRQPGAGSWSGSVNRGYLKAEPEDQGRLLPTLASGASQRKAPEILSGAFTSVGSR
jgi:hypothetical protein